MNKGSADSCFIGEKQQPVWAGVGEGRGAVPRNLETTAQAGKAAEIFRSRE